MCDARAPTARPALGIISSLDLGAEFVWLSGDADARVSRIPTVNDALQPPIAF